MEETGDGKAGNFAAWLCETTTKGQCKAQKFRGKAEHGKALLGRERSFRAQIAGGAGGAQKGSRALGFRHLSVHRAVEEKKGLQDCSTGSILSQDGQREKRKTKNTIKGPRKKTQG